MDYHPLGGHAIDAGAAKSAVAQQPAHMWCARMVEQSALARDMLRCLQHLAAAARHFSEALNFQKGNIYAANGLGAVLASLGRLEAARSIFSQLRESAALTSGFVEVPDVRFSLSAAHL